MKKISISIPKPCHENWNDMTPGEKGRFCASCQKTVIDFSVMSDRQIAAFLKKPASSLCGRFHSDQLERELVIPKKQIPWMRYFFQVMWPAFVLFLKSCGQRENVVGKMLVENARGLDTASTIVTENLAAEITPLDPLQKVKPAPIILSEPVVTMGIVAMPPSEVVGDTVISEIPPAEKAEPKEYAPMDTVAIQGFQSFTMGRMMAGAISVLVSTEEKPEEKVDIPKPVDNGMKVYPNPVRSGMQLTIDVRSLEDVPKQVQLFSSAGNLVRITQFSWAKGSNLVVTIPSSLAAGTYFIRVLTEKQQLQATKLIIIN